MIDIFEFLKASDDPAYDQLVFLKAQIAFWLLGAIDGHAKNFSVFLYPGGGFQPTLLYDVMSAQHLLDGKQLQRKNMKFAMSVGKNRHYRIHEIQPRHFRQTAIRAGLSERIADTALNQVSENLSTAIETVCASLPSDFPVELRDSIAEGVLYRSKVIAAT